MTMTAPAKTLTTVTERERLRRLAFERRQVVIAGRAMLYKRGRIVRYCDIDDLADTFTIAAQADQVCLSPADFDDVKRWLG